MTWNREFVIPAASSPYKSPMMLLDASRVTSIAAFSIDAYKRTIHIHTGMQHQTWLRFGMWLSTEGWKPRIFQSQL